MGSIWLHDLPDVVEATGLPWGLWPGWETRARSSGGYDQVWAVFCHHTASPGPQQSDCEWEWNNSDDRPIGALNLGRDGTVMIGAAGATNTQGKGGPWTLSHGTIPLDKGNTYGIAIEAGNRGTGEEPWPEAQTSAYVVLVAALCDAYGLDPARDVLSHAEWVQPSCPGRKIDPAGPSPWADGSATWEMDAFRFDVACGLPPEPPEEDEVTPQDIDAIAEAVYAKLNPVLGARPWQFLLGNRVTGAMDEAGDILRSGAYEAFKANPDNR